MKVARTVAILVALGCGCNLVYDPSTLGPGSDASDAGGDAMAATDATAATDANARDDASDGGRVCPGSAASDGRGMVAAGDVCIDSAEVDNAHYATFLAATMVTRPALPASCAFKTSLRPDQEWPAAAGEETLPVRYVDWCDALSYCLWAGKRLCGRRGGGGTLRAAESVDPAASEWTFACTGGRAQSYPYGPTYDDTRCNTGRAAVTAVPSTTCEGGSVGLFDLVGNVAEWVDACESADGSFDECRVLGGSYLSPGTAATCGTSTASARGATRVDQGIRCCF